MGLFNGGLKDLLQGFHPIQNIANAVGGLLGSVTGSASNLIGGVAGAATGILNTPVLGAVAGGLAEKYTGVNVSSSMLALKSKDSVKSSVQGSKATALGKFFNIYKLVDGTPYVQGSDGTAYLNVSTIDGKKELDWMRIGIMALSVLTLGFAIFKVGKSKRWWK